MRLRRAESQVSDGGRGERDRVVGFHTSISESLYETSRRSADHRIASGMRELEKQKSDIDARNPGHEVGTPLANNYDNKIEIDAGMVTLRQPLAIDKCPS